MEEGENHADLEKVQDPIIQRERVDTGAWLARAICRLTPTQGVGITLAGEAISPSALRHLLHNLRRRKEWKRSIEVLEWMMHRRVKLRTPNPKHYAIVISACRDAGELQAAMRVRTLTVPKSFGSTLVIAHTPQYRLAF